MYCLSSLSNCSLEQVAAESKGPLMFELDLRLPQKVRDDLLQRVLAHSQYKAVILNAFYRSNNVTENEWKHDFELPPHLKLGSLEKYRAQHGTSEKLRDAYGLTAGPTELSAQEVKRVKSNVQGRLKVVVKGVMCPEDALDALDQGADAIWVSNGGSTKPFSAPATIQVLPHISKAVKAKYPDRPIFIDSGISRGTDVVKCIAYGASAVFISRPVMWALQHKGEEACTKLMTILNEEIRLAMALTHCYKLDEITEAQVIHQLGPKL